MNRVEQMMKYHGIERKTLCERSGVSEPQLSRIIRGQNPSISTARALADVLDVPIDYLFPKNEVSA